MKTFFSKAMLTMIVGSFILTILNVFMGVAFASLPIVPEVDLFQKLAELIMNWGSLSSLAKGSLFVLIATQALKQAKDFEYKRLVTVILAIMYGVAQMLIGDVSISSALITILISGGGAIALYEVLKPFLKSIPFFDFLKLGK